MHPLFQGHNTDKGFHHTYEHRYQLEFEHVRTQVTAVLELGILHGGSLRAWRDYFPDATIVGMDIDPAAVASVNGERRITALLGDAKEPQDLYRAGKEGQPYDLIVDDASHRPIDQFQALKYLWQYLKPGGLYVVEDLDLNRDPGVLTTMGLIVRGETEDIRIHLGDSEGVRNDDLLILEKR